MKILHRLAFFLTLLTTAGTVSAAARSVVMRIPDPIAVPTGVTEADADKALKAALVGRGWVVNNDEAGAVDATLMVRQHELKMHFTYTGGKIAMSYVQSAVLGYKEREKVPYIHPNVMKWLGYLAMDINANLLRV